MSGRNGGMILTEEEQSARNSTGATASVSTWTNVESNPDLLCNRPATNRLRQILNEEM
jgi:hypothetical protein